MGCNTRKNEFVADTVAMTMHVGKKGGGVAAKQLMAQAEAGTATIFVPAMVFAELVYLTEKKRLSITMQEVYAFLDRFPDFREYPLNKTIVERAAEIIDIPELHDRLIAGTARYLEIPLITSDATMIKSKFVTTIWE